MSEFAAMTPVSVKDHLPVEPGYYLAWEDKSHTEAHPATEDCEFCKRALPHGDWAVKFFDSQDWWLVGWSNGVTHWMPLPPAPQGGA